MKARTSRIAIGLFAAVVTAAFSLPVFAQGYGESPYIFGIHDPGGEHVMAEKGKKGWILFTEEVGRNPADYGGKNFRTWADQGYGVIVRINHGYSGNGTIPYSHHYDAFAQRVANYVANSPGAHIWIIGNETNHAQEWPAYEGWTQQISPSLYATCYKKCRAKIKALGGHSGDQVLVQGTAPWNIQIGMEWVAYHVAILNAIGQGNCDGMSLHCYTHGTDPNLVFSEQKMNPPYQNRYYHFRTYRDFLNANPAWARELPVYITETDEDNPWADTNSGWVRNAYWEINNWNRSGKQVIRALCLYRWPWGLDQWGFGNKPGVVDDFRQAMDNNYRWDDLVDPPPPPPPPPPPDISTDPEVVADGSLRWQAENYGDYHDTTTGNAGGAYRTDNVDIETCSEGGYNVGWIAAGEWLGYTYSGSGTFKLKVRHAGMNTGSVHVEVDGVNVSGSLTLPATGGWQTWAAAASGVEFTIGAGAHDVVLVCETSGFNVNHFTLVKTAAPVQQPDVLVDSVALSPANPEPGQAVSFSCVVRNAGNAATPSGVVIGVGYKIDGVQVTWGVVNGPLAAGASVTVGANGGSWTAVEGTHTLLANADDVNRFEESNEDNNTRSTTFSVGGAGGWGEPTVLPDGSLQWEAENYAGYHDTTPGNSGGAYRQDDVDIETCSEGGYNVGWIDAGEYLDFTFTGGGTYTVEVRHAGDNAQGMHIEVDGVNVSGAVGVGNTGGWQTWATATGATFSVGSGTHSVRVVADTWGWNLNYFRFKSGASAAKWSTGFEAGEPGGTPGQSFPILFSQAVSGPADHNVGDESVLYGGAAPKSGSRQNRIMGTATTSYSYAYHKIADVDVPIASGDVLTYSIWFDSVPGDNPIAVDLKFSDGTWMRDSGMVDQYGTNAHPGQRYGYTTRTWLTFTIDLSKKAGKRVTRVAVAYDNGVIHATGAYRAYVDDISIASGGGGALGYTEAASTPAYPSGDDGGGRCGSVGLDLLWPLGLLYLYRRRRTRGES